MKKSNLYVVAVILFVVLGSASLVSAKGHGGSSLRDPYVWEPKTSAEKIIEYIRIGADDKLWKHSIYQIGVELEGMEEVSPEILSKLSDYSQHILDRFFKSQDVDEARKISEALTLFKEKGVKNLPDIQKALHHQYAVIGKKLLDALREKCKSENREDTRFILRDIDAVLAVGVSLQKIGVSSVEEMRDLALCR